LNPAAKIDGISERNTVPAKLAIAGSHGRPAFEGLEGGQLPAPEGKIWFIIVSKRNMADIAQVC
jgi:hypothetical protein